ncbi:hypothetical protein RF55_2987 [Lasius niger]|uniref:Uncharacterized protein n=1 Tax=Lasius niger TaxID=67767 RepID=A0A0J7L1Q1_LASNI|nr:hypothetical protein RF55_2987 [Lasius niger]
MKWILLLAIFAILQYGEVKGYPQYNNTERDLGTITQAFIEKPIEDSFRTSRTLTLPRFQILPYLNHAYNDTLTYITKKLELLETSYKELAERLKEFIEGSKTSKEDKKDPSPENTVSNNTTQENVILTTPTPNKSTDPPTPDKSTNTQKPTPAEDDDKNKKPDDTKNPLHTSETASNNKTQENVTQTIPKPVESLATQEPVPTENDKEEKPAEQEDKKDTLVPIKNDKDENEELMAIDALIDRGLGGDVYRPTLNYY